ncbi:MAG: hypothetical protein ACJ72L_14970 [Marmoricola sp.]
MRLTRAAVLLATAAIALSGCTSSGDQPKSPAAGIPPTRTTSTPTPTATGSASTTPTPTADPTPSDGFLPTDAVPGLNKTWHWQDGTTGLGDKPFGVCAKADLSSIGAELVRERTYFPPDDSDDSAGQLIAGFADAKSAAQAWSVLDAWRGRCAATLGTKTFPKVGAEIPVPVAGGKQARWYLVSWAPPGEETGRFEAIGMVRDGALITVLRITNSSQDYNYPAGKEPMVAMVQRAAARISAGVSGTHIDG